MFNATGLFLDSIFCIQCFQWLDIYLAFLGCPDILQDTLLFDEFVYFDILVVH